MTHPQTRIQKLLIANRGEIALRIARTATEAGIETCAVAPQDDLASLHALRADHLVTLPGRGAAAYLDGDAIIRAALEAGCDAVHPGYGFLSENAEFARAAQDAGLVFVGPTPQSLELYGDKLSARALAERTQVPTLPGTSGSVDAEAAAAFFETLPEGASMIVKAVAGGGGRGMRVVDSREATADAVAAAGREAGSAFGNPAVYVERFIPRARHIEVQIIGDGTGQVMTLGERDCTLQRRHQKLIEIAPAPHLSDAQRRALHGYAEKMACDGSYRSLGTFEFLLDQDSGDIFFIEANPRIQVEHTITEEVFGLDLVALQLRIAGGATLDDLELSAAPRGTAIQTRVNMERVDAKGAVRPSGGTLTAYDPPAGPGLRVDGFAYAGYTTSAIAGQGNQSRRRFSIRACEIRPRAVGVPHLGAGHQHSMVARTADPSRHAGVQGFHPFYGGSGSSTGRSGGGHAPCPLRKRHAGIRTADAQRDRPAGRRYRHRRPHAGNCGILGGGGR